MSQTLSSQSRRQLASHECRDVEFKSRVSAIKPEHFVAFANGSGGNLFVGVAEERDPQGRQCGRVVGCDVCDLTRQKLINMAASCRPSIDVTVLIEESQEGVLFLRIDIPEGKFKPYCTASGVYKIRIDGRNSALEPEQLKDIILQREAKSFQNHLEASTGPIMFSLKRLQKDMQALLRLMRWKE